MAYNKISKSDSNFSSLMNGFGIVTVMNARIYELPENADEIFAELTAEEIRNEAFGDESRFTELARIKTLKVANVTVEGPEKTITGGQYSNPLLKYGKTARLEMQDALGNAKAIEAFGGAINEYSDPEYTKVVAMHVTEDFAPVRMVIGDSFFIDQATGKQVKVNVMFYQVSPDSILNLVQDAEGDASVFDMNGDLLVTEIRMDDESEDNPNGTLHGVFYSIIEEK